MVRRYLRSQECDVPILQTRKSEGVLVSRTYPVTFNVFRDGLLHGPGRPGRSGGPPWAEAGVSPSPNCFESGAGALRIDSRWRGDLELAPRGRCDAASQTLRGSAVTTMLWQTLEHAVPEKFGAEKQNFCGPNTMPGSQWVHHPFLGNYWNGEGGGNLEVGASEMWMVCRVSWLVHRWAQMSCWTPNNGIFKHCYINSAKCFGTALYSWMFWMRKGQGWPEKNESRLEEELILPSFFPK